MDWLNYHHLLYFHAVAHAGSIARAAEELHLAQPTISGQLRALEAALGEKLLVRAGRGLALTDVGRTVLGYADEIFGIGRELMDTLRGQPTGRPVRLTVGIADVVPKIVAHRLLLPALSLASPVRVTCREDKPERLVAELATHDLDLVLADAPTSSPSLSSSVAPAARVRVFHHLLGESGVSFFAAPSLARLRRNFPRSLDGAPLLLPLEGTALRRGLDQWLDGIDVRPRVVGEFEDSALMEVFGQSGAGVFAAPTVVERDVTRRYGVRKIGAAPSVRVRFFAISVERRLKHPAVVAISEGARRDLF